MSREDDRDRSSGARHLESTWVSPTHCRRGVMRSLLDAYRRSSPTRRELTIWVVEDNPEALRAYARLGFAATGERRQRPDRRYERRLALYIEPERGAVEGATYEVRASVTGSVRTTAPWRRILVAGARGSPVRQRLVALVQAAGVTPTELLADDEPLGPGDLVVVLVEPANPGGRPDRWTEVLEAVWSTQAPVLAVTIDDAVVPTAFRPWPSVAAGRVGDLPRMLAAIIDGTADLPRRQRVDSLRRRLAARVARIRSATDDLYPVERGSTADGSAAE